MTRHFLYMVSQELYDLKTGKFQSSREVSLKIGKQLFEILIDIEDYFYSDFWIDRLKRKLEKENIHLDEIDLDIILGTTTEIIDTIKFEVFETDNKMNGLADMHTMIGLNTNMTDNEINDSHIYNLLMHELGHKLYNEKTLDIILYLNKKTFGNISGFMNCSLNKEDLIYFTDHNELRSRIIPIIREMIINNWTYEETYFKSPNLIQDDIYKMYSKDYIIYLLLNIL